MLEGGDTSPRHQPQFLNILGRTCRQLKTIPDSMRIDNCLGDPTRHLQHPNILPFIGVNLERHRLAMVSEWMDHGDVNEAL